MSIQVLGCGNILKGDDGFGVAVVEYLEDKYKSSDDILIVDAGLACGEWITPLIEDEDRPDRIIMIDVLDMDLNPGDIKVLRPSNLNFQKKNLSSHFFPEKEIFDLLEEAGVEIIFVSAQLKIIPRDLSMNISDELIKIVPEAARIVAELTGMVER